MGTGAQHKFNPNPNRNPIAAPDILSFQRNFLFSVPVGLSLQLSFSRISF